MVVSLSTRTAYLNIVISLRDIPHDRLNKIQCDLKDYCDTNFNTYAFILHDKDLNEDNTPKTLHFHLVGIYHTNRQRLSTILNDLACHLQVNNLAISIDKMNDINGSLQYLIHQNNASKYQYDISNIVTNLGIDELKVYMTHQSSGLSTSSLLDIIVNSSNKVDVYKAIGLEYYRQYRQVVNDLWFEIHGKDKLFACDSFSDKGLIKNE